MIDRSLSDFCRYLVQSLSILLVIWVARRQRGMYNDILTLHRHFSRLDRIFAARRAVQTDDLFHLFIFFSSSML